MPDPAHPDLESVRLYLEGAPEGRDWLAERLQRVRPMTRHAARRMGGCADLDLADVEQEASATAIRRLPHFAGHSSLDAWLYNVCKLTLRSLLRRARRRRMAAIVTEPIAFDAEPTAAAASEERAVALRAALAALGGTEAEIIRLRHFENLDFRDIAARQDTPMATVRTRYYRGLDRLRRRLATDPDGESPSTSS
ncbi:MAG: RNA polymerase sigma factor [Planctomycetota bacterium]